MVPFAVALLSVTSSFEVTPKISVLKTPKYIILFCRLLSFKGQKLPETGQVDSVVSGWLQEA